MMRLMRLMGPMRLMSPIGPKLKDMNRIRAHLRVIERQQGRSSLDNLTENLAGVLLTLVVTENCYLYFLLVAEPCVIVHLTSKEGIGLGTHGFSEHEIARSATDDHALYGALQQLVVLQCLNAERLFHSLQEGKGIFTLRQIAHDTAAALQLSCSHLYRSRMQQLHIDESQLLSHAEVHAILCIVQIRVGRIDTEIILNSQSQGTLHEVGITHLLQPMEEQRVVANDEVATEIDGFAEHLFGHV